MRYSDFKIVENVPDDGSRAGQEPSTSTGLQAGPPYPPDQMDAVRDMQRKLEELGYSVGNTGIDGKYGPRTARAVAAYLRDRNIEDTDRGRSFPQEELTDLASAEPVDNPSPTGNGRVLGREQIAALDFGGADNVTAKQVAEEFLGNTIQDNEWNMLVRATVAEALPNSPEEQAAVMGVILNRVRTNYDNNGGIRGQLYADNQFQAVTGTGANGRTPSRNYTNPSSRAVANVVQATIDHLPNANKNWMNFTSNNPNAYGAGTNIDFMYTMRNSPGSRVIGGTVFGTA